MAGQLYRFDIGKLPIDIMYLLLEKLDEGDFYQLFNCFINEGCEYLTLFLCVPNINLLTF